MKTQKITVEFSFELEFEGDKTILQQLHDKYSGLSSSIKQTICQRMGWSSELPYVNRIKGDKELSPVEISVFAKAFGVQQDVICSSPIKNQI